MSDSNGSSTLDDFLDFVTIELLGCALPRTKRAPAVIEQLVAADPQHEYRQLGVIDADGFAAARTGQHNRDWAGHHVRENFIGLSG